MPEFFNNFAFFASGSGLLIAPEAESALNTQRPQSSMEPHLENLFRDIPIEARSGDFDGQVKGLETDSRRVAPDSLFFALEGLKTDGNFFVEEAIERGAKVIVSSNPPNHVEGVCFLQVRDIRGVLARVARRFNRHPDRELDLVGVTGTNGKTTVAHLVHYFLANGGTRPGMLGTVNYDLGGRTLPASRTTPESPEIYSMLAQMRNYGCRQAILEVSSHGIHQKRVQGLSFKAAAFLNLTRDHIDYHSSMEDYFEVKAGLFTGKTGSLPEVAVINIDDPRGRRLVERIPPDSRLITFGENPEADFRAENLVLQARKTSFDLRWGNEIIPVVSPLPGRYNVSNVLAAFALCHSLGCDVLNLAKRLEGFTGVPGRMERVDAGQPFNVLVDYAHTDDALKNALDMLRAITPNRLMAVFGCGGDRDRKKRPLMTRAVMEHCDFCWATSDNPRSETPAAIFEDMKAGVTDYGRIAFVEGRRRAISLALDKMRPGDCLLIAGKGHETYQELAGSVLPFDDRLVTLELLRKKRLIQT